MEKGPSATRSRLDAVDQAESSQLSKPFMAFHPLHRFELLGAIIYVSWLQTPFGTFGLGAGDWMLVVALALSVVPA